jgi:hypothetical protein
MKTIILVTAALIVSVGLLSAAIPYAHAVEVPSTVEIIGLCGLEITSIPPTIDYGFLAPNAESSDQTLEMINPGNLQATVLVRGTDWSTVVVPVIPNAMLVGATHYSLLAGQAYGSKTALTGTDTQLTTLTPLQTQETFWQLKATLNDPATVGAAIQAVTLTGQC